MVVARFQEAILVSREFKMTIFDYVPYRHLANFVA